MQTTSTRFYLRSLFILMSFLFITNKTHATHAQSADLTYTCLGGNQYQINLSFYRDCAGVAAPNNVTINVSSATCGQNLNITLNQIPNTGIEVTPICNNMTTVCSGGNNPGVQEWKYSGIVNLPMPCVDWTFSFQLCCRNNAISTINAPGNENIYVEAMLDNENFPCNSSPSFSNPPIPFVCASQNYCFNHGATDVDGDSLVYYLIPPMTSPNTTVTYLPGYSAQQPLQSNPAVTFNQLTGDICMTPTLLEVTVMAVKVEEYRNGQLVGSVIRDIQLRTIACSNNNPFTTGINGTGQFQMTACAGNLINFNIPSFDNDVNQNVAITWNNGIPAGSFSSTGGQFPSGNFSWTPTANDISNNPYCFTITVTDNNCPFNGSQTYSFCITVTGFNVNVTANNANCGASNGNASASVSGGTAPYTYQWSSGSTQNFANGLAAGNYNLIVTDNSGCQMTTNFAINNNSSPGNTNMSATNVSCFGGNDGAATVNVNGGQAPYTYLWSNGATTNTVTGLTNGWYYVTVTTANGCVKNDSIFISAPSTPVSSTQTQTNITCNGMNNGTASVTVSGGTAPYYYTWTNGSNNASINNLATGNYSVTIMDSEGCTTSNSFYITQPQALTIDVVNLQNVTCFGNNNGSISVQAGGGNAPYNYSWSTNATGNTINNLGSGSYSVTVTDNNGCTNNFMANITEPQPLIGNVFSTNVSCYGANNGTASVSVSGGTGNYTYNWNTVPSQTTSTINGLDDGSYSVVITDQNNCSTNASVVITEPTPINITVQGSGMICPGQVLPISVNATGGNGNYTYHWSNSPINSNTQNVSPAVATTYTVYVTDNNGCTSTTLPIDVTINDINLVNIQVIGTPIVCAGSAGSVEAILSGGTGVYTYTWNNGLPSSAGPHTVVPAAGGYYTVTLLDDCGNSRTESVYVDVEALPIVNLTPQSAMDCGATMVNFNNNGTSGSSYFFEWNFGDGNTATGENVSHDYTTSGNYNVTLTITSQNGCVGIGTTTNQIIVNPNANAIANANKTTTSIFEPEFRFYNNSTNSNTCFWDFGDGNTSTQTNPVHKYEQEGTYTVTLYAYNGNGCNDTTELEVIVHPEFTFFIPNAFTPDGDGVNDTFFGKGTHIAEYNMLIFDRWGEMVFSTENINQGWDGLYRGATEPKIDVYVYKIKLKDDMGEFHYYDGHVTIVR